MLTYEEIKTLWEYLDIVIEILNEKPAEKFPRESIEHKIMKETVIKAFLERGYNMKNILIEKRIFKHIYKFIPDITIKTNKNFIFIECHAYDDWSAGRGHLYRNIEKVRNWAKVIICMSTKELNKIRTIDDYVYKHRVLSNAHEIWSINTEKNIIESRYLIV